VKELRRKMNHSSVFPTFKQAECQQVEILCLLEKKKNVQIVQCYVNKIYRGVKLLTKKLHKTVHGNASSYQN